jgi:hypothetical protein
MHQQSCRHQLACGCRQVACAPISQPDTLHLPCLVILTRPPTHTLTRSTMMMRRPAAAARPLPLLLIVAAAAVLLAAPARAQDCPEDGCDIRRARLVCGEDGSTYMGECLAACQGVKVAKRGACKADDTRQFDPAALEDTAAADGSPSARAIDRSRGVVDLATMNRFKHEGFTFVGLGKVDPNFKPVMPRVTRKGRRVTTPEIATAVRFVYDTQHMYIASETSGVVQDLRAMARARVQAANITGDPLAPAFSVGFDPTAKQPLLSDDDANGTVPDNADWTLERQEQQQEEGQGADQPATADGGRRRLASAIGRKLKTVFDADDRTQVFATSDWPW